MRRPISTAANLPEATAALGFRRVERVDVVVRAGGVTARATGVLHRYPFTVPVSLATATRLVAAAAPCRIDRTAHLDGTPC